MCLNKNVIALNTEMTGLLITDELQMNSILVWA